MEIKEIWNQVLTEMEQSIGKDSTDLWIKSINPLLIENNTIKLEIPNSIIYENIKKESYDLKIIESLKKITGMDFNLDFSISIKHEIKREPAHIEIPKEKKNTFETRLIPRYLFENIIEGESNRFAITMSKKVALNPGKDINPFFIYSQPGMGKTHLLHAIGNEILKNNPNAKILFASADIFVDEYIRVLQEKNYDAFRNKYRSLDCLLLDDVQFIVKKESSEQEFFHTFNALFSFQKQIVVTSDKAPNDLELNERLVSRFMGGTIADIKQPEYELRVAILDMENRTNNYNLPSDVIKYIANSVTDSIRSLKGCISTVAHYCANNNIYPSIDTVENLIKDYVNPNREDNQFISIEKIKEIVAKEYNIGIHEFNAKTRAERVAFARQIAMYLASTLTNKSLPEIGKDFNKDHSTVIYSRDKIMKLMNEDPFFNKQINEIITKLKEKKG